MKQIKSIALASLVALFFTACGGGSSGTNDNGGELPPVPTSSYLVSTLDGTQEISLGYNQNIIAGYGCTSENIYDSNGNTYESDDILPAGNYSIIFNESYGHYTDSKGILYYQSANIPLSDLALNENINVPNREAVLYRLVVNESSYYVINQSGASVRIFDVNLKEIISTALFSSNVSPGDAFELVSGTYYIVGTPSYCTHGGSFTLTEL